MVRQRFNVVSVVGELRILIRIIFRHFRLLFTGKLFVDIEENQSVLRSRYKNLGKFDVMHIMADLENEVVLATIKYRANDGLLLIYPDFNAIDSDPYFREINSDSRHIYQYSIENLSTDRRHFEWSLKNDMSKLANKVRINAHGTYQQFRNI